MASFVKVGLLLVVVVIFSRLDLSAAKIYTVGNSMGWTILNNPNYTAWAARKTFHEGDIFYFKYNKQFHNVLEVSKTDYNSCNSGSPSATYSIGNDSINIKIVGHHYFICWFLGHCQIGQKVDIFVGGDKATAPASSAAPSPSLSSSPAFVPSTAPSTSSALAPSSGAQLSVALSKIIEVATMRVLLY